VFYFIFQNTRILVIGRFQLNSKSRKAFNIIMSTKTFFWGWEGEGAAARQSLVPDLCMDSRRTFPQTELFYISAVTHMLCARELPSSIVGLDPVCLNCRALWFSSLILSEN
jgi:hypothetical protein